MRDMVLLIVLTGCLALALKNPFAGVLSWAWLSLQTPQQETYSFLHSAPINLVIALVTLAGWLLSSERKTAANSPIFWLSLLFLAWATFNSFFAFDPNWSWPYWDRTWRIFALGFLVAATATTRVRMYALIWVVVISLFYFGVKGGLFTIATGGHYGVTGPPGTLISDNNLLGVALLMSLPLANFLRSQASDKRIQVALMAGMVLTALAIIGTYSRGAFIGLLALGAFALIRARRRFLYLGVSILAALLLVNFMPDKFFGRMQTVQNASQDASFAGRVMAWKVATHYAIDHFPFGAGFYGPQLAQIFHTYFPGVVPRAAHSIYFQVLGEHGFIGLALYLLLLALTFIASWRIIKRSKRTGVVWVRDLAIAIQSSVFVFCVAGSALSMAYYDVFVIEMMLLIPLGRLSQATQQKSSFSSRGQQMRTSRLVQLGSAG